jgi:hypothetical protein
MTSESSTGLFTSLPSVRIVVSLTLLIHTDFESIDLRVSSRIDVAPLFQPEPNRNKEPTPPPFQDVASPDSNFSNDEPAPTSTSIAAPTPSPVVVKPVSFSSPRVPSTPSRPGMALQRVVSGNVSRNRFAVESETKRLLSVVLIRRPLYQVGSEKC